MKNFIKSVAPNSIAEELGVSAGSELLTVNGAPVKDVFAFRFAQHDEFLTMEIKDGDEITEYAIEKDEDEDLGLEFESGLMAAPKRCHNKCLFCFIDQMPPNMRETLYFKDDDTRLSFLTGNYVTLTNMDEDLDDIISYHLSPINVSVHTTNAALRARMLCNYKAGAIMERLRKLRDGNIEMNFQIVLCKGINDGNELAYTLRDLAALCPKARSASVVPVGLTRYREENGLCPLVPYAAEDCAEIIKQINALQKEFLEKYGTRFVYAADEFYVKAGAGVPHYDEYDDFPQLENGVGSIALMKREFDETLEYVLNNSLFGENTGRRATIATGVAAYGFIKSLADELVKRFKVRVETVEVKNEFFGENVTVSGLLTGRDIINALKARGDLGDFVIIPGAALKADENIFLDDVTLEQMENELGVKVKTSYRGKDFVYGILED